MNEYAMERIPLPSNDDVSLVPVEKGDWIGQIPALTKDRASALLARRWRKMDKRLLGLRDRILSGEPTAIVRDGGRVMLELIRRPPAGMRQACEITYCVMPPCMRSSVVANLQKRGLQRIPLLADFLSGFDGLRDRPLFASGNFVPHRKWKTIGQCMGAEWRMEMRGSKKWTEDIVFYEAPNGDQLLLGKGGRIGWYVLSESSYRLTWNSFDAFLRFYISYQDQFRPFDSFASRRV